MLLLLLSLLLSTATAFTPLFVDVTIKAGIQVAPQKLLKYGGPTVADLDRDGLYDLIFVHHGSAAPEIYFNDGLGKFSRQLFSPKRDVHAVSVFTIPEEDRAFISLVPGGNAGNKPNPPVIYRVTAGRDIVNVTDRMGVGFYTGRGRTVVFMPLRTKGSSPGKVSPPDALFLNADASPERCPGCTDGQYDAYSYSGNNPYYKPQILQGFKPHWQNDFALAVDPDGKGQLAILSWRNLTFHKITGFFKSTDVSKQVLGDKAYITGGAAAVEIDFDNDGDFDLYIAMDKLGDRESFTYGPTIPDLLLENRGGKYVDVGVQAGIPRNTISRGVTAGDFNNDGYMDLYVSVLRGKQDVLLLNNGDGTFKSIDIGIGKNGASGDNALAVDYDNDGRVDLIRSEGDWGNSFLGGQFRILRNIKRNNDKIGGFIKVRVGKLGGQTSQHAVVKVWAQERMTMQRVGQAGVQVPHSYLDTLHFGIGGADEATVAVTWLNGETRARKVTAGETVTLGSY